MEQDEALSIFNDFKEILQSEVYVDLERLRLLARHGIPNELRGQVWKYLLGVEQADRSKELTSSKARHEEYEQMDKEDSEIAKKIRGEVYRFQARTPELAGKHYVDKFVNIITAYLIANRDVEYYPALITLCAPFIYALDKECDAYFCFERLLQTIEEEVNLNEFTTSWLQYLLSKELKFQNLIRLWDAYFSIPDPLEFHPFVCLAILRHARENLEDLEQSEIRTMLLRLPFMDMRPILADAYNLRNETIERQLFEESEML
ncbi:rab-GTPase-TBC domain-containing protein [Cokeromyces recurvatus]|uniref:rab-GTPase-TBC domain-containing protein n=1 Tax=Cokeromyces recurvatus TaxID=90255 RepID=UPI00221ED5EA|nr:rab-GTPase-TBC domain-containing protein [Cokeromyces recurvatus]KAI7902206.1 rab-GTPase-TBC domain-containing protein [Cokeromyces recurvatus]